MKFFKRFRKDKKIDPNEFWNQLSRKVELNRQALQALGENALGELIAKAQGFYIQAISASKAGEKSVARSFYRQAFELLPTHIEALDNCGISLVEEFNFLEAIPLFEQSAVAEPSSPLAFVYLVKCYEETEASKESVDCARYMSFHWPDKSPYIDWSHLGKQKEIQHLAPPLEEGQVWLYSAREADENSTIWIKLIEQGAEGDPIVHISVVDVLSSDNDRIFISHLPYNAKALLSCLTTQLNVKQTWGRSDDLFGKGYGLWSEANSEGKAGVFTAPISEVLDGMFQIAPPKHKPVG